MSYLNLDDTTKNDKSLPKMCLGFNVGVTIFISIFALLFYKPSNYFIYILFGILDVAYFIFVIKYRNPMWQILLTAIGLIVLTGKTFWGYIITSQFEFVKAKMSMFTWIHASVLVLAIGIIFYVWAKFYQAYKILKDNTIEVAQKKISEKNPMPKWAALTASLLGSPMILVRLLKDDLNNMGLGLGFAMWGLGVIFFILFAMLFPKLIVLVRFSAWNFTDFCPKSKK